MMDDQPVMTPLVGFARSRRFVTHTVDVPEQLAIELRQRACIRRIQDD